MWWWVSVLLASQRGAADASYDNQGWHIGDGMHLTARRLFARPTVAIEYANRVSFFRENVKNNPMRGVGKVASGGGEPVTFSLIAIHSERTGNRRNYKIYLSCQRRRKQKNRWWGTQSVLVISISEAKILQRIMAAKAFVIQLFVLFPNTLPSSNYSLFFIQFDDHRKSEVKACFSQIDK